MYLIFWSICLLLISVASSSPIAGGQDVGIVEKKTDAVKISGQTEFPYMANLLIIEIKTISPRVQEKTISQCGGVIISENAVLTAAHCIKDAVTDVDPEVYIRAGVVHLDHEKGQRTKMKKYLIHDEYIDECIISEGLSKFCFNDIGIVWLVQAFVFGPSVNKANLIDPADDPSGKGGWILGWGVNREGKSMKMLQKAYMNVLPNDACQVINNEVIIADHMICLISETKTSSSCDGDSGGPFIVDGKVYGISSFNAVDENEKCDPTIPVVYTNVGFYKKWIQESLAKGPSPSETPSLWVLPSTSSSGAAKSSKFRSNNSIKGKLVTS